MASKISGFCIVLPQYFHFSSGLDILTIYFIRSSRATQRGYLRAGIGFQLNIVAVILVIEEGR